MKKIFLSGMVLALTTGLCLAACGKSDTSDTVKPAAQSSSIAANAFLNIDVFILSLFLFFPV